MTTDGATSERGFRALLRPRGLRRAAAAGCVLFIPIQFVRPELRIPSATDVLVSDRRPWQGGYRSVPVVGAAAVWSRSAQQRLNFLPEPQGQGALRPGLSVRVVSRREAACARTA
jgi:hypothetical protein